MIDLSFNIDNNDCELVFDDTNMINACIRRLDTQLDTTLYDEYGSSLRSLLGLKKTDVNLDFLSQSIIECLGQDERLSDINVDCEYTNDGFRASIGIVYEDNTLEFDYEASVNDDADIDDVVDDSDVIDEDLED